MTDMLQFRRLTAAAVAIGALLWGGGAALAEAGFATPWQLGMQDPATEVMDSINRFHNGLLWTITAISAFVLGLLVIVMVRFNAGANPTPSRTTHNTVVEVAWTVIPVVILSVIAIFSFKLLFLELEIPAADLTVKATGKQWYWTYSYPDNGKFEFDSLMVPDDKINKAQGQLRLLAVDNEMVVPVNKIVRVLTIGNEVIHSFAVPSFGIRIDAVPGRLNETWFKATREGTYYGQCSELCGRNHAFMPIAVKVVSEQAFKEWVDAANKRPDWKSAGAERPLPAALAQAAETNLR
jgi:cytochrome c oxidase subunit II